MDSGLYARTLWFDDNKALSEELYQEILKSLSKALLETLNRAIFEIKGQPHKQRAQKDFMEQFSK